MTGTTYNAKAVAREVSKRVGRTFDAKRVRAWVRENVPAYDDDGYTAHVYDRPTFDRIVKGMTSKAQTGRAKAASEGRKASPAKPKTRKAAKPSAPIARVSAADVTAEGTTPTVSKA